MPYAGTLIPHGAHRTPNLAICGSFGERNEDGGTIIQIGGTVIPNLRFVPHTTGAPLAILYNPYTSVSALSFALSFRSYHWHQLAQGISTIWLGRSVILTRQPRKLILSALNGVNPNLNPNLNCIRLRMLLLSISF